VVRYWQVLALEAPSAGELDMCAPPRRLVPAFGFEAVLWLWGLVPCRLDPPLAVLKPGASMGSWQPALTRPAGVVAWTGGGLGGRWESAFKERLGAVNDVKAAEVEAVESLVKEQRKNKKSKQTPEERRAALEEAIRDTTVTHEGWL
jgi:hypothetical protein